MKLAGPPRVTNRDPSSKGSKLGSIGAGAHEHRTLGTRKGRPPLP